MSRSVPWKEYWRYQANSEPNVLIFIRFYSLLKKHSKQCNLMKFYILGYISRTLGNGDQTLNGACLIFHTICRICDNARSATSISIYRKHQNWSISSELGKLARECTVGLTLKRMKWPSIENFPCIKISYSKSLVTSPVHNTIIFIHGTKTRITLMFNGLISFARLNFANGSNLLTRKMRTSKCIKRVKRSRWIPSFSIFMANYFIFLI